MAATFNLVIKVSSQGTAEIGKITTGLDKAKDKVLELNRAMRQVFGIFAIRAAVTEIYSLIDGYTSLQNKLRVVAKDEENLQGLTNETYKIAQQTRSGWAATATIYGRVARSAKELGVSQKDLLAFTKSLNQAIVISGATTMEAQAGLIQLSQAMASGALRGDELRSVLENTPVVAQVIAKQLGVTIGQLRKYGTEGKISAKTVIEAFKNQADELDKTFGKTIPTMAQMWQMLENAAQKFFGEAAQNSGVLQTLGRGLQYVIEHFNTFGKILIAVGEIAGVYLAGQAISRLITALNALRLAALANPFTALLFALISLVIILRQFGDQLEIGGRHGIKLSTILNIIWKDIQSLGRAIYEFLNGAFSGLTKAFGDGFDESTGGIKMTFQNVLLFMAAFVDAAIGMMKLLGTTIVSIFTAIPKMIGDLFYKLIQGIAAGFQTIINTLIRGLNEIVDAKNWIEAKTSFSSVGPKTKAEWAGKRTVENEAEIERRAVLEALKKERAERDSQIYSVEGKERYKISGGIPMGKEFYRDIKTFKEAGVDPGSPIKDTAFGYGNYSSSSDESFASAMAGRLSPEAREKLGLSRSRPGYQEGYDKSLGRIAPVDFSVKNPYSGSVDDLADEFRKNIKDAKSTDTAGSYVREMIERAAREEITKVVPKTKKPYIDDTSGPGAPLQPSDKEIAAAKKLQDELERLMERSNPITKAQIQLSEAGVTLYKSVAAGTTYLDEAGERQVLTWEKASEVYQDYAQKLEDTLHPMEAFVRESDKTIATMKGTTEEQRLNEEVMERLNKLKEKGRDIDVDITAVVTKQTKAEQDRKTVWELEQKIYEQAAGPAKNYAKSLEALYSIKSKLTSAQFQTEFSKITSDYMSSNDSAYAEYDKRARKNDPLRAGVSDAAEELRAKMLNVSGAVRDAFVSTFDAIETSIIDAAETGKLSFEKVFDTLRRGIAGIALKILEMKLTLMLTDALKPSTSVSPGLGAALAGALGGGYGGSHAVGGSYKVPGNGGNDSKRVTFDLTPGETVDFRPPGSSSTGSGGSGGRGTQLHIHDNPRALLQALDSKDGERIIMNTIRRNPGALRSINTKS